MSEPRAVAVTIGAPPIQRDSASGRRIGAFAIFALPVVAILIGIAIGYLAYVIESPGTSLAGPCLLVLLLVGVATIAGWWWSRKRNRSVAWLFAAAMCVVGVLVVWWAWAYAMPASMAWDSSANANALTALRGIEPEHSVCEEVSSGSIGPLGAPYERCAIVGVPGATVTYYSGSAASSPARGLIFFEGSRIAGTDQFVRHLVGDWYAFSQDPTGILGYSFTGGV